MPGAALATHSLTYLSYLSLTYRLRIAYVSLTYHRLALQPADFGPMRRLLDEAGLPLLVLQEGGYHMENIAAAAAAFWAG